MPLVLSGTVYGGQGYATTYNMPKRTANVIRLTPKRARYGPSTRRPPPRRRRNSKARPMRSLKTNYRALNVYRFVRETLPQTVTFDLIAQGPGSYPAMGYMTFDNLQMNQLPGINSDFVNLFARYKVDKIVTKLTPMWEEVAVGFAAAPAASPELEVTRVNTKYMIGAFPIQPTAVEQLTELAQLQAKSVSKYSRKKPLYITTINPGTTEKSVIDASGTEVDSRGAMPWLSWNTTNIPIKHNSLIFARRLDGTELTDQWKYAMTHKIYFRCSQVG